MEFLNTLSEWFHFSQPKLSPASEIPRPNPSGEVGHLEKRTIYRHFLRRWHTAQLYSDSTPASRGILSFEPWLYRFDIIESNTTSSRGTTSRNYVDKTAAQSLQS